MTTLTPPDPLSAAAKFAIDLVTTRDPGAAFFNLAVGVNPVAQGLLAAFSLVDKLGLVNHGTEPSDANKDLFRFVGVTGRQYASLVKAAEDDGLSPRVALGAASTIPSMQRAAGRKFQSRPIRPQDVLRDQAAGRHWSGCYRAERARLDGRPVPLAFQDPRDVPPTLRTLQKLHQLFAGAHKPCP